MIKFKNKKLQNKHNLQNTAGINLNNKNIANKFDMIFDNIEDLDVEYIINM